MKIAFFSVHAFEAPFLLTANTSPDFKLFFFETPLNSKTANMVEGFEVISCFVSDHLDAAVLEKCAQAGVKLIALRSAGFNNVDIKTAKRLNIKIARVPAYSPYAVAEYALGLILALNRKIYRAYNRVRENNFSLEGLLGFDIHGKTIGVMGTGKIGTIFTKLMHGFGVKLLGYDIAPNEECLSYGMTYTSLAELYSQSDIISLHCPLNQETFHMINQNALEKMKDGIMLINTGRGALLETKAVIIALKNGKIGSLGIDVYEEEENLFFQDLSSTIIKDDQFARLQTFNNVLITGHQAFFTREALVKIAETTLQNIKDYTCGVLDKNVVV